MRNLVLWLALAATCLADGFTLQQIVSSAFPTELTAAPAAGKLAWVENARGVRNIWVAAPPDYRARAVTRYSSDDGQEISDLEWTPDASALLYVRGGAANRQGEIPNPLSDPKGAEQAVWLIVVDGGEPKRLRAAASWCSRSTTAAAPATGSSSAKRSTTAPPAPASSTTCWARVFACAAAPTSIRARSACGAVPTAGI